jgi:hypothetical protein
MPLNDLFYESYIYLANSPLLPRGWLQVPVKSRIDRPMPPMGPAHRRPNRVKISVLYPRDATLIVFQFAEFVPSIATRQRACLSRIILKVTLTRRGIKYLGTVARSSPCSLVRRGVPCESNLFPVRRSSLRRQICRRCVNALLPSQTFKRSNRQNRLFKQSQQGRSSLIAPCADPCDQHYQISFPLSRRLRI